ncbi:MAG: penicillin-binding transpeptidase domain-containing protein, partial [Blastocatellia bacterium]
MDNADELVLVRGKNKARWIVVAVATLALAAFVLNAATALKRVPDSRGSAQADADRHVRKNPEITGVANPSASSQEIDGALQHAASRSLGDREGTVLVMDPATGRLRAVVNSRLAFEQAFPPGSAIKPFTTLAAMRSGVIDSRTRMLCQGSYANRDFRIVCSHPRSKVPFDLPHALAYSCNYYFAKTAERLSPSAFETVLVSYGFGRRTGVNAPESPGRIPDSGMRLKTALGEGDQILVTPIQLLRAYVALFSGRLFRPQLGQTASSRPADAKAIDIVSDERAALLEGLRGAVTYGTAMNAGLKSVPLFVYGKTGTSTASNGFRTQGWFVSMAAEKPGAPPMLAVLVFLKRSHGSEGAEVARGVYE